MSASTDSASIDIEEAISLILDGYTDKDIAKHFGIKSRSTVTKFLNQSNHSARVREARTDSADAIADKAEEVLRDLKPDSTPAEVSRARELAQHYRWLSKVRKPKVYGDKVDVTTDGEKITGNPPSLMWPKE